MKYVSAEGLRGTALFLVSVDNKEYAFPVDESYPTEHTGDDAYISVTDGGLKTIADQALTEHNEYLAMIEQVRAKWEEEHPGEPFVPIGGDGLLTIDFAEVKTNRIINISDYLKTGVSARAGENDGIAGDTTAETDGIVYALGETSAEDNGMLPLIIGICAAAVVVTVAAVLIVRKKKTKV